MEIIRHIVSGPSPSMSLLSALIDYDNFKDMIKATPHQKAKLEPYEEFWSLLYNAHFSHRPRRE
jgi:hypothetical protein